MNFSTIYLFRVRQNAKWFFLMALGYGIFYWINNLLTASLYLETGAHIVHLPSGVRMVIVLIAGLTGAIALMIATFPYVYLEIFSENLSLAVTSSIATGLIPLIAIYVVKRFTSIDSNLSNLTPHKLFFLSITFAVLNTLIQQSLIFAFGESQNPLNAVLVMFTGDILGIFIVLYVIRIIGKIIKSLSHGSCT